MTAVIDKLRIQNFGPIKDGTLELSPLHALIGPNDSGKSTMLAATAWALRVVSQRTPFGSHPLVHAGSVFRLVRPAEVAIAIEGRSDRPLRYIREGLGSEVAPEEANRVLGELGEPRLLRLDPDSMRRGSGLLSDFERFDFLDERGSGLGRLIDGLFARKPQEHVALTERLRAMFATVDAFRLFTANGTRAIGVRLKDGTEVRPEHVSEGMLYFLAFSLLPYIEKPSMLLIEEPENGLHPARIKEVVRILREVSKTTQVLLATHSPLVINELEPHEVTIVTRTEAEGTKFTRMDKTPHFAERSSAWNLGELWIALSDGVSEEALLNPTKRKA